MMVFDRIGEKACWMAFYEYKKEQINTDKAYLEDLLGFIEGEGYLPFADALKAGRTLCPPKKILINKTAAGRKRTVYTYPKEEAYILSMIAYLLKEYDHIFAPNLYSFRKYKMAKTAFKDLMKCPGLSQKYVYRSDISAYFNSVNVHKLLPKLKEVLVEDLPLWEFFRDTLTDDRVLFQGEIISENKGIIPGASISSFLANLYLSELDYYFYRNRIYYIRYSDDILVLADTEEELGQYVAVIHEVLAELDLGINPDKEHIYAPGDKWEFLGFCYRNGAVDISEVSLKKIKDKLRRKTGALKRWVDKKNIPGTYGAKALVKRFNSKFYDNPVHNELTWALWYFPIINTTASLQVIDRYEVDCIRYLATGKHTKKRYDFTYADVKNLGFRSLVHEYYKWKESGTVGDA